MLSLDLASMVTGPATPLPKHILQHCTDTQNTCTFLVLTARIRLHAILHKVFGTNWHVVNLHILDLRNSVG